MKRKSKGEEPANKDGEIMSNLQEEKLAESVRKYPVLYDKSDSAFKDRGKKRRAWEDVADENNINVEKKGKISSFNYLLYYSYT